MVAGAVAPLVSGDDPARYAAPEGMDRDLTIEAGDAYMVLECAGDAVLIEVLGDPGNPYMVSSNFLRSVSDFPSDQAGENE